MPNYFTWKEERAATLIDNLLRIFLIENQPDQDLLLETALEFYCGLVLEEMLWMSMENNGSFFAAV